MAYTLGNKCAKNLCKRTVLLQLIIENVVTCFFGAQCIYYIVVHQSSYNFNASWLHDDADYTGLDGITCVFSVLLLM